VGVRERTFMEQRRLYLQARLVIERHYAKHLTVALLARALASSPRQLQRAFARFGASTFREDLAARRLRAAAELLAQPAMPVGDVARLVGYRQPSHFSKAFRARYGISPARFRAQLKAHRRLVDGPAGRDRRVMLSGDASGPPQTPDARAP
jgi:AraC-like DNA-binding protein